ncbi:MAG: oligosaccharide flippase family protein [Clostridia bacterium]
MGRTEKSLKNAKFAILAQLVTTLLTFVSRTVMAWTVGVEAVSLNGLFTEVIAVLSLTELGVGSAIVYNLYKPLADGNQEKVCELMTLFKKVYRIIAFATLCIGTILCPFIQYMIKEIDQPIGYIRLIYMLFVLQISASYLFTYKASLLNADQKQYVVSIVNALVKIAGTVAMLAVLYITGSFILYLVANILTTITINIVTSLVADKMYPYLHEAKLPKEESKQIFRNVKNIFIKSLSGKITNSTDNILISVLVSTITVGYYSFYAMVVSVFKQLIDQLEGSVHASVGNLFASEANDRCKAVLHRLTWIYASLGIVICTCIYSCMETFMTVWMGEEYLLGYTVLFVICINLFMYISCKPIYIAMHMIGEFEKGRNISIIGSVVNLIVSIVLGKMIGITGIFLGTVVTYVIQVIMKIYYVYKLRFKESPFKYSLLWISLASVLIFSMLLSKAVCHFVTTPYLILDFIVYGIIGAVISGVTITLVYCKSDEFHYSLNLVMGFLKKKKRSA